VVCSIILKEERKIEDSSFKGFKKLIHS